MKRLLIVAAIAVIVAPAFANPEALPIDGSRVATYDMATGELIPGQCRMGPSIWAASDNVGWYTSTMNDPSGVGTTTLDWGDIANVPGVGVGVGGIRFCYATAISMPQTIDVYIWYYGEENGRDSVGRTLLQGYYIPNLPALDPNLGWGAVGWTITVDLEAPGNPGCFILDGSDLDGDGLTDFGYAMWFDNYGGWPANLGPCMGHDPNIVPSTAPGVEDIFDLFGDPNLANYLGTYWFGGAPSPYAQFYMELYACANMPTTDCPTEGKPAPQDWYCTADISPAPPNPQDCIVGLGDLAALLANYGMTAGATHHMGDVHPEDHNGRWDPTDGDTDVDLADLAQLLGQYGDNCN